MHYYKIKIMKTSGYLNESAGKAPKVLYVESKEALSERQALIRASKKYKGMYGAEIRVADVEQISEGIWDRMKAGAAGLGAKAAAIGKNAVTSVKNGINTVKNTARGAAAGFKGQQQTGAQAGQAYQKVSGAGDNAKVVSLLKSKLAKINKMIQDADNDFAKMGVQLPPDEYQSSKGKPMTLQKRWVTLKSWANTFMREADNYLKSQQQNQNQQPQGPNANEQASANMTNNAINAAANTSEGEEEVM